MEEKFFAEGSVPVSVAARVYGKDSQHWQAGNCRNSQGIVSFGRSPLWPFRRYAEFYWQCGRVAYWFG